MLYLPYGPYDGIAASGTSGQSKGEIKGRGGRQRNKEREEITRPEQRQPPKHSPLYQPAVYPFTSDRCHLLQLQPHELCPRAAVFPHLSTHSPQQEGTPLFGEDWMYLHRLGTRTPFSADNIHLPFPQHKIFNSPALTKSLQEDPPPPSQTYCQSTASSSWASFKTEPVLGPVPPVFSLLHNLEQWSSPSGRQEEGQTHPTKRMQLLAALRSATSFRGWNTGELKREQCNSGKVSALQSRCTINLFRHHGGGDVMFLQALRLGVISGC